MKNINDKIQNAQNRRSGELSSRFYETNKNSAKPHGCHINFTAAYIAILKCVLVPHNTMGYHTGNVYYSVVRNAQI